MSKSSQAPAWCEKVRRKDSPERTTFLEAHVDLVRYQALRIAARLPASVERDDMIHDGILGLMEAADGFDPERGVSFRSYAETRVRGAILDGLRRKDWRPRSVRAMRRDLDAAASRLGALHRRQPTQEELADALGLTLEQYQTLLVDVNSGPLLSLDEAPCGGADGLLASGDPRPDGPLDRKDVLEALAEELVHLPERERRVLELYYVEALSMKEVGAVLGVTESRVCQIHAQAAARLRCALTARFHATAVVASFDRRV